MELDQRLPVTLLTGFLGSGKTSLLNSWLKSPELSDAAVIVNEFGEVGIDHALIASSSDNTIELSTGCLCCTVSGDLVDTLRDLIVRRERGEVRQFNRVIIETTGLADPVPVIQALMTFPVARRYRLNEVVTTVDVVNGSATLDQHPEAVKQVAVADQIILTKSDLLPNETAITRVREINRGAGLHPSALDRMPSHGALGTVDVFDPETKGADVARWLNAEAHEHTHEHAHRHSHDVNRHNAEISSFTFSFDEPLHWEHVANWLDALVLGHGPDLLRVKGILNVVGRERPIVVHAVQSLFHPPVELPSWPSNARRSQIVFITRNLDRAYVAEVLATIRQRNPTQIPLPPGDT
jgi:G3E family GTPase